MSRLCGCFCSWGSGRKHFIAQGSVMLPVRVVSPTKIDRPCCLHFAKSSWGKQNNHLRWSARSGQGWLEVVEALSKTFRDLAEKSSCQHPLLGMFKTFTFSCFLSEQGCRQDLPSSPCDGACSCVSIGLPLPASFSCGNRRYGQEKRHIW